MLGPLSAHLLLMCAEPWIKQQAIPILHLYLYRIYRIYLYLYLYPVPIPYTLSLSLYLYLVNATYSTMLPRLPQVFTSRLFLLIFFILAK